MIYGTSHFESFVAARRYYHYYDPSLTPEQLHEWVSNKVTSGEIHIGKPELKPNQKLKLDRSEGRYFIVEGE
jgi:hypothetical protein